MCDLIEVNREKILKLFNKTDQNVTGDLKILRDWLNQQPHLPNIDDARLERILLSRKFSIEKAKSTIEAYFTKRNEHPEYFDQRDPCSEKSREAIRSMAWLPLKYTTDNCERISVIKLFTDDPNEIDGVEHYKYVLYIAEILLQNDYINGQHIIFDCMDAKLAHLSIFTPELQKKVLKIFLEAYGSRMSGLHFINPPPFMDSLVAIFKAILKDKIFKRLQIHKDLDSLHAVVPKKLLPIQYGGECGNIFEIRAQWQEYVESMRSWFLEDSKMKTDESKRPKDSNNNNNSTSIPGTFKKLDVD